MKTINMRMLIPLGSGVLGAAFLADEHAFREFEYGSGEIGQFIDRYRKKVQAIFWDAPRGGHQVQGKLSFPTTVDGKNIFDQASSMTITINDVDANSRVFTW